MILVQFAGSFQPRSPLAGEGVVSTPLHMLSREISSHLTVVADGWRTEAHHSQFPKSWDLSVQFASMIIQTI